MPATSEATADLACWTPAYYGNRFMLARLFGRRGDQEERGRYRTLHEARAAAEALNALDGHLIGSTRASATADQNPVERVKLHQKSSVALLGKGHARVVPI